MKSIKKVIFIIFVLLFSFSHAFADDLSTASSTNPLPTPDPITIHLSISTNAGSAYNQNITVNACNNDNGDTSNLEVTAYCAILQSGIQSDWNWSWPPGAFLNSLDNIAGYTTKDKNNNDVYHYWDWSLNGTEGATGLNEYQLQSNDIISLTFIDPQPTPAPAPASPIISNENSGGSFLTSKPKPTFDLAKATSFLLSRQKTDGSFGEDLYIDWATIALASNPATPKTNLDKVDKYFSENKFSGNNLTDHERHAMALMASA